MHTANRNKMQEVSKLTYVLFWISMAQAQRMIDESNVQIPKVRAWRPFTEEMRRKLGMRELKNVKKIKINPLHRPKMPVML